MTTSLPDIVLNFSAESNVPDRRQAFFKRDPASAWADGYICCKMVRNYFPTILQEIQLSTKSTLNERLANWQICKIGLARLNIPLREDEIQMFARRDFPEKIAPYIINLRMELLKIAKSPRGKALMREGAEIKALENKRRPSNVMTNMYLELADQRKMTSIRAAVMSTEDIEKQYHQLKSSVKLEAEEIGKQNKKVLNRTNKLSEFLVELRTKNMEELKEVEAGLLALKTGMISSAIPSSYSQANKNYNIGSKRNMARRDHQQEEKGPSIIDELMEKNLRNQAELQMNDDDLDTNPNQSMDMVDYALESGMAKLSTNDDDLIIEDSEPEPIPEPVIRSASLFKFDASELISGVIKYVRQYDRKKDSYYYTDAKNKTTYDMPNEGIVKCTDQRDRTFYVDASSRKSTFILDELIK